MFCKAEPRSIHPLAAIVFAATAVYTSAAARAAGAPEVAWSSAKKPIHDRTGELRSIPDKDRGAAMRSLALQIRRLPAAPNRLRLAIYLASLSTEGDFGAQTLQEVAATLEAALRESPVDASGDERLSLYGYSQLASLARYEHVLVSLDDDVHYQDARRKLAAIDAKRAVADFTLTDLAGKAWTLSELHGKIVLINFWATCCPPCRKEMPDLEALHKRFSAQGLVVLGISDEDPAKVGPFVRENAVSYPVLLDPGKSVKHTFALRGIPNSFVFDRSGQLVAEAMDMRTQNQFLAMLRSAGLE